MIIIHLTYVTNGTEVFIKCCIKGWVHLDLQTHNLLFGELQPLMKNKYIA